MGDIKSGSFAKGVYQRQELDLLKSASQDMSQRAFIQGFSNSGMLTVRQYRGNGNTVQDRRFTNGYRPLNSHNHSNFNGSVGMAERSGIANGYPYKSRHTDYLLREPAQGGYLATQLIPYPSVPPSVTGTVAEQITEMQNYFQALNNKDSSLYDYRPYFKWVMAAEEVWPERFSENITDTFPSDRHQVDASNVHEQLHKHWRDEYGGVMERAENINVWPIVSMVTGEDTVEIVTIKNRVICNQVGDLGDYHFDDLMTVRDETYAERRAGEVPIPDDNKHARFKIDPRGLYSNPQTLDELMYKCHGMEGVGSDLTETYYDKLTDAHYNIEVFGGGEDINAAKFTRFYNRALPNASGRKDSRRGFNDPYLFAALTDHEYVLGVSDGVNIHRYTWAIPMELIMMTPLHTWNPHNIQYVTDPTNGGLLDGETVGTALLGYNNKPYYYLTPDEFYNGADPVDPADTTSAKWVLDGNGIAQLCRSSGVWIILPSIDNVTNRVRTRFPIYEDAIQDPGLAEALSSRHPV